MNITNGNYLNNCDIKLIEKMEQSPWAINNTLPFDMSEIAVPKGKTTIEIKIGCPTHNVNVVYSNSDSDKIREEKKSYEKDVILIEAQAKKFREKANELFLQLKNQPFDIYCELTRKAEELSELASVLDYKILFLKRIIQELQQILDGLAKGSRFAMTHSTQKYGEYDSCADKVILYIDGPKKYESKLLISTLVHELFHAFYHKHQPCSIVREIDEAMVEFSMLTYLSQLPGLTQDTYFQKLFDTSKISVKNKKYGLGELPAYGFGAYLYEHCNNSSKWIAAYYDKIGTINNADSLVQNYIHSLNPSYTHDEKKTYENLSTILFAKANVGYVKSNTNNVGDEFKSKIQSNVEITCTILPNGNCAITGVDIKPGRNQSVTIPPSIRKNGKTYPITEIWGSSFPSKEPITVRIPDSVTDISQGALDNCSEVIYTDSDGFEYYDNDRTILKGYVGNSCNISIPNSVISIGPSAFENRHDIKTITIPTSVAHILEKAFAGCEQLHGITISSSVIFIGEDAFKGVVNISNNSRATGFPWGARIIIDDFEYADAGLTILKKYVGNLETIITPPSISQIVVNAFVGCSRLRKVEIPSAVTFIGEDTYHNNMAVSNPQYIQGDFEFADAGMTILKKYHGCSLNVTIPGSVTIIAPSAFENCHELQFVTIPQSVTQIWKKAFANCERLRDVIIPKSVRYVGKDAFKNVANVSYKGDCDIYFPWGALQLIVNGDFGFEDINMTRLLRYMGDSNAPIIPNSVTEIGHQAFKDRPNLSIIIPSAITKIETDAFIGCDLLNVYSSGQVVFPWSQTRSFEFADAEMTILKKYRGRMVPESVPSTITQIEPKAFEGCTFYKPYNYPVSGFPWGAKFIMGDYEYADAGMTILKKYHGKETPASLLATILQIEPNAFEGYTFKEPCNYPVSGFPWGARFIVGDYEYADAGMTILKKYRGRMAPESIPSTVTKIEPNAFEGYTFIKPYNYPVSGFPWGARFIVGDYEYADAGMTILKKYRGRMVPESIPSTITKIEPNAFEGYVFSYNHQANISGFPWGAHIVKDDFEYSDVKMTILNSYRGNMDEITIPDTVQTIQSMAFNNRDVQSIRILKSSIRIEERAFVHCSNLTKLMFPDSVLFISHWAFFRCFNIQEVVIGDRVYNRNTFNQMPKYFQNAIHLR